VTDGGPLAWLHWYERCGKPFVGSAPTRSFEMAKCRYGRIAADFLRHFVRENADTAATYRDDEHI